VIGAGAALVIIAVVVALLVHRARRQGHAALVAPTNGGGVVGGMPGPAPVLAIASSTVRLAPFPTVTEESPNGASPPANGNGNGHSTLDGHSTGHAGTDLSAELARPITDGAPGWRHDPDGRPDHIRYFDGRSWTDFYARKIVVLELAASS